MANFQLSGLASGFDWKSVVDQLIALERVPQNRLRTDKTTNLNKLSAYSALRTKLTALQTAVKDLTGDTSFSKRSVSLANEELTWKATAANGTVAGEYTFDVTQLATRSVRTGAAGRAASLHTTNDVSGLLVSELRLAIPVTAGIFSINGEQIEIEETDTLEDVFDRISEATEGDVTAAYESSTDRVTLTSASAITLGSGADTSNFLYALKLYNNGGTSISSASNLGTIDRNEALANAGLATAITAVDASGNGSFVINDVAIEYNVNDDTLQDIINRVNASAAGVTLSYDAGTDQFSLTNKNTGDLGLVVSEGAGGLLDALGLTGVATTHGLNAQFSVNGGSTIVSASNVLTSATHGVTGLSVTATSTGEQTVNVDADTEGVDAGIRAFIAAFNDVQKFIEDQTKVSVGTDGKVNAALMADNRELSAIARELRSRVFSEVPGLTGTIRRLESIGIDFDGSSSELAVRDEAKLSEALGSDLAEVSALFATASTGMATRIDSYVTSLGAVNGLIDAQETTLERRNVSLDNQIAELERRLEAERTRLEGSFIRMEEAQSLISSQLAALQSTLNLG